MNNAPNIDPHKFTSMMRLDHDRSKAQVALKYKVQINDVKKIIVWGNHSNTQVPDLSKTEVKGEEIKEVMNTDWYVNEFIPRIQKRGAEIIEARGLSSAASAANAAVSHMRDWAAGSSDWLSIGQISNNNTFGITNNIMFSFPSRCSGGVFEIVNELEMSDSIESLIKKTESELVQERDSVLELLK